VGGYEGIMLLFGQPGLEALQWAGYHVGFPVAGADRVQTGGHDTVPLATIPAVTVAVHHASRERDLSRRRR
jgi:hypothetical protein